MNAVNVNLAQVQTEVGGGLEAQVALDAVEVLAGEVSHLV